MDQRTKTFLRGAVGFAEKENGQSSVPAFAGGGSGMSFGQMQNDIATNKTARQSLYRQLTNTQGDNGLETDEIVKATLLGSRPGITKPDFERRIPGATDKIASALQSSPDFVAAQDDISASRLTGAVDQVLVAAQANSNGTGELGVNPNLNLLAKLGAWGNRTGGWLRRRILYATRRK